MSAAETVIKQGVEQGTEQGIEQGARQTLIKGVKEMIKLGMSTDAIAAPFELSPSEAKALIEAIQKGEY